VRSGSGAGPENARAFEGPREARAPDPRRGSEATEPHGAAGERGADLEREGLVQPAVRTIL
jgi:hypothetical protein